MRFRALGSTARKHNDLKKHSQGPTEHKLKNIFPGLFFKQQKHENIK